MVSRVRLLEAGWIAPRATKGMERRVINCFLEFDQGGAWVVEESNDVTSGVIGWLLDFA